MKPLHHIGLLALALSSSPWFSLHADPHYVGPKTCQECHKAEYDVWEKTKHSASFRDLHRNPKVAEILAAAGGDKNIRRNSLCTQCHYTLEQTDAASPASAKSGVSCESCHGAASDYVKIHNDYGGPNATRATETASHREERIRKSVAAGMRRPESPYDLAANCLNCHSLARSSVDGPTLARMLAAGHPINPGFELVKYSQGSVRHRFYHPNITVNAGMTPPELARFFVAGRAAMLVTATEALNKSDSPAYKAAMEKQIAGAREALSALKDIPEAAALLAAPTDDHARRLVAALSGRDVSAEVKAFLPAAGDYK